MSTVFFDDQGPIHNEFIPGLTVNKEMYIRILHHIRDAVRRCPENLAQHSWCLLHNNSPASVVDGQIVPCESQCDGFGAFAVFPGVVTT
jgi:hypothetical protein